MGHVPPPPPPIGDDDEHTVKYVFSYCPDTSAPMPDPELVDGMSDVKPLYKPIQRVEDFGYIGGGPEWPFWVYYMFVFALIDIAVALYFIVHALSHGAQ